MKQYAKNACGTIALIHIAINAALREYPDVILKPSYLAEFQDESKGKTPK